MLQVGDLIDNDFQVLRLLDEGGMGAVYVVRQVSTNTQRALKVIQPQWALNADLRERFAQEARVCGQIASEHVIKVFKYGIDSARDMPWLVMEYLSGDTLDVHCQRHGRPSRDECERLLAQLFHGVAAAHDVALVHRDLKPNNVFVARSQRADVPFTVKVLDFGIAKDLSSGASNTKAMGTKLWMAPEQDLPWARVTPATDVWALGLLTFWLISGYRYWLNAEGSSLALLQEMFRDPLVPASLRAEQLGCDVCLTPEFDAWFAGCVAHEPSERFAHASHCWMALQGALASLSNWPPRASLDDRLGLSTTSTVAFARGASPYTGDAGQTSNRMDSSSAGGTALPPPIPETSQSSSALHEAAGPSLERSLGALEVAKQRVRAGRRRSGAVVLLSSMGVAALGFIYAPSLLFMQASPGSSGESQSTAASESLPSTSTPEPLELSVSVLVSGSSEQNASGLLRAPGFRIDTLEVSTRAYETCVAERKCSTSGVHGPTVDRAEREKYRPYCNSVDNGRGDHPINCIDRHQAQTYCNAQGKRLPTRAEWLHVAVGSTGYAYPWGQSLPVGCGMAVLLGQCEAPGTRERGTRSDSSHTASGVMDLIGNVAEWVVDDVATEERTVPEAMGMLMGGAWDFNPGTEGVTAQQQLDPMVGHVGTGVRCASDL